LITHICIFLFSAAKIEKRRGFFQEQLTCIFYKLSITIFTYLINSGDLNKADLEIFHYSLHHFSLWLPEYIDI